jgi:hypothetical protein
MDGESFDRLSVVVHRLRDKATRRSALGLVLGGSAAALSGLLAQDVSAKKHKNNGKKKHKNCRGFGAGCKSNKDCCNSNCRSGRCWQGKVVRVVVVEKRVTTVGVAAPPTASRSVCQTITPFAAATRVSRTVTPAAEATAVPAPAGSIAARASSVSAANQGGGTATAASSRAIAFRTIGTATI